MATDRFTIDMVDDTADTEFECVIYLPDRGVIAQRGGLICKGISEAYQYGLEFFTKLEEVNELLSENAIGVVKSMDGFVWMTWDEVKAMHEGYEEWQGDPEPETEVPVDVPAEDPEPEL